MVLQLAQVSKYLKNGLLGRGIWGRVAGMSDGLPEKTRKIIAGIPVAELRSFVERMAVEHDDVHNELIAAYSPEIGAGELRRFQSELDDVIERNSDGCGFISYRNSYDFACDMESVLCRQCEALKKAKRFRLAMAVAQYVFLQLKDLAIDDSNGTIGEVAEMCCDIWRDVLPLCTMEEKKALFVWLHGFGKGESADHTSYLKDEYADVMLMTAFPEKVFVRGNLKVLDRRIGELTAAMDKDGYSCCRWALERNLRWRIGMMRKLPATAQEIKDYRARFHHIPDVRREEIRELLDDHDLAGAIALLEQSRVMDKESAAWLIPGYSRELIDLYYETGQAEKYKQELWSYIFMSSDGGSISRYKKTCSADEWLKCRKQILQSREINEECKWELMRSEGLYAELFNALHGSRIGVWDKYESCLKDLFPERLCDIYVTYVRQEVQHVSDRSCYRLWAGYLQKIATYPGGKEIAAALVAEWRTLYARRRALMEELSRAGF